MLQRSILQKDKEYNFIDYFNFSYPTKDIASAFGYKLKLQKLDLPRDLIQNGSLDSLKETFHKKLPHISLTSESAKKEFLVSPIFYALLDHLEVDIDVEYPININNNLKGKVNYMIRSPQNVFLVEAKNADMEKGFTQLAVELIALDKFLEKSEVRLEKIYGAITVGNIWRFGMLDRKNKTLQKDMDAFLVPSNLEELFAVFLGILSSPS